MFRSKNKNMEANLSISIQEIEEDMLTFKHNTNSHISTAGDDGFWKSFKIYESQMIALKENSDKLKEYKQELEAKRDEINNERINLQQRLEKSLSHLRKLKSP
ncbi:hypothetical protein PVAND_005558 [Polypedilum vanderplanki]|uniref:Uncharacterized protein n=1 Tax=Polypedilum vanderplanki TaxID=319348 RepID=A0A9J6C198_POLVA|nr:hypothetical protein PVAND_005558 [Polypedilum vanderplanki]